MPRLSIIVPHIFDVSELESTLLSILENRPQGAELLVVHAGDYRDPYHLNHDEIHLLDAPASSQLVELVNVAARQASSPILHVLLPGCRVETSWTASAMAWFQDPSVGMVSPSVGNIDGKPQIYAGLDAQCLPRRAWSQCARRGQTAIATLCGGFYRRQTIRALDGWMPASPREGAEAEMALAMQALSMRGVAEPESRLFAPRSVIEGQLGGYALGNYAGKLAIAYSQLISSPLASDSLAARIGHLAGGLISPSSVAERLGWVLGVADRSLTASIRLRIEHAEATLPGRNARPAIEFNETRRAA